MLNLEGFVTLTIFLIIIIGPIAVIKMYGQVFSEFVLAIWNAVFSNPELQSLFTQMFAGKPKEYLIGNIAYILGGLLLSVLPVRINGSKAFWIIYGLLLFVVNGVIVAI